MRVNLFFAFLHVLTGAKGYSTYLRLKESYPTCGDCFCIPSNNGSDPCPSESPETEFSETTLGKYKSQQPEWFYKIDCNPYVDSQCETSPHQIRTESDVAVCGLVYTSCDKYIMETFSSREAAEENGAAITHEGSCGLCSTTQDLAIYLGTLRTVAPNMIHDSRSMI